MPALRMSTTLGMTALALVAGLALASCSAGRPLAQPTPLKATTTTPVGANVHDVVGWSLDEAWEALEGAGATVSAVDARGDRSVWAKKNWVVVSQERNGSEVVLRVEKTSDPVCWSGASDCQWVTVFEFDATEDAESQQFTLNGGPARLTYTVDASSTTDGRRVVDIEFQDVLKHTESSYVDTIIHVDHTGNGVQELGDRDGTYFLMVDAWESYAIDLTVHVIVEQMRATEPKE